MTTKIQNTFHPQILINQATINIIRVVHKVLCPNSTNKPGSSDILKGTSTSHLVSLVERSLQLTRHK